MSFPGIKIKDILYLAKVYARRYRYGSKTMTINKLKGCQAQNEKHLFKWNEGVASNFQGAS
uniref:Uncharacterized protein n=1 Tax=Oryza nivara TaxID=4536 RepID=A0A0E0G4X8_ORYNI